MGPSTTSTSSIAHHARVAAVAAECTTDLPTIHTLRVDRWDVTFQGRDVPEAKTLALRLGLDIEQPDVNEGERAVTTTYHGEWHDVPVSVIAYVVKALQS